MQRLSLLAFIVQLARWCQQPASSLYLVRPPWLQALPPPAFAVAPSRRSRSSYVRLLSSSKNSLCCCGDVPTKEVPAQVSQLRWLYDYVLDVLQLLLLIRACTQLMSLWWTPKCQHRCGHAVWPSYMLTLTLSNVQICWQTFVEWGSVTGSIHILTSAISHIQNSFMKGKAMRLFLDIPVGQKETGHSLRRMSNVLLQKLTHAYPKVINTLSTVPD